jgi:hypothetical protein
VLSERCRYLYDSRSIVLALHFFFYDVVTCNHLQQRQQAAEVLNFIFLKDMALSDKAKQQRIILLLHASKCPFGSAVTGVMDRFVLHYQIVLR